MLELAMAATLPLAPVGAVVVAAPALDATAVAARTAVAPVPRKRAQRRPLMLRLVRVSISWFLFPCCCPCMMS
jgi:hypothetical protein